jgi:hypothetical protein
VRLFCLLFSGRPTNINRFLIIVGCCEVELEFPGIGCETGQLLVFPVGNSNTACGGEISILGVIVAVGADNAGWLLEGPFDAACR